MVSSKHTEVLVRYPTVIIHAVIEKLKLREFNLAALMVHSHPKGVSLPPSCKKLHKALQDAIFLGSRF